MRIIIRNPGASLPVSPYNQAILADNSLFFSGQNPLDRATGKVITIDISAEAKQGTTI
jgi:2-iminobutanoate/2-iminopropanoate deaminase